MTDEQMAYLKEIQSTQREVLRLEFPCYHQNCLAVAYLDNGGNHHRIIVNHDGSFRTEE